MDGYSGSQETKLDMGGEVGEVSGMIQGRSVLSNNGAELK